MKKVRTILGLTSALLMSTAAQAWESNWLLGVSGGWTNISGNAEYSFSEAPFDQPVFLGDADDSDNSGSIWGVFAGYQARCNGWLLGGELNVDWHDHNDGNDFAFTDLDDEAWVGNTHFKRETVVGLTGRLGYAVSSFFMPYLRAGIETSRDKLEIEATNVPDNIVVSADGSRRSYRFVGGVGAELPVPALMGLSIRAEWNYHSRGRSINADTLASDNVTVVNVSAKPHENTAKISLVWNII